MHSCPLAVYLPQKPAHGVVEVINHTLLKRDDRVVGDVNIFRANFRAAFRDVAQTDTDFVFEQFGSRQAVQRMHFQTSNAIIPLKERVVDDFYDPVRWFLRKISGKKVQ